MPSRFVQIHALTSYPGALLNRDDAGFAKRLPFGGAVRTRVSSQCLKRHWRVFDGVEGFASLDVPDTIRSRNTFEVEIVRPLVAEGHDEAKVRAVVAEIQKAVLSQSEKAKAKDDEGLKTGQITVLGRPEVEHLRGLARRAFTEGADVGKLVKAEKDNLKALRAGMGLSAALFGRMVTSDILARCDAAVHVAHAFTVHPHTSETDYFAAVDDLLDVEEDGQGSGHIGNAELTSGLYYVYVVVDVPLLVSNLTGSDATKWTEADRELAARVVERLVKLVAKVSPGAKRGSTAPYSYAQAVLVETGDAQPRTLANAFLNPVATRGDVLAASYDALAGFVGDHDAMYGRDGGRWFAGMRAGEALAGALGAEKLTLDQVAAQAADAVRA